MLYLDLDIPITVRKIVWGLLIHDVLGSNFGAIRFLKKKVLVCSFNARGQKIMFHIYAMGNIVGGVEFVIKTWTFFIFMHANVFFFLFSFCGVFLF
jgi:hypothetical protein